MKKNHFAIFATVTVALCAAASSGTGCSSSKTSTGTAGSGGTSTNSGSSSSSSSSSGADAGDAGDGGVPPPPTLGTQIDRIGRPAINTALNNGFDGDAGAAGSAKDAYNADGTPSDWAANYTAQFAANLAIIDAVDGVCGNQLIYDFGNADAGATATSYSTLATVLTDDRLYLNTAGTTDAQYLAVEANFLGITNNDQGGRGLPFPVMDVTYSVLAIGALTGVTNGIPANEVPFLTTFPYLAAPNGAADAGDGG